MKKLILAGALAALIGSPVFAQSFTQTYGTGNSTPFAYKQTNTNGDYAFAQAPGRSLTTGSVRDPAVNGATDPDPNIRAQLRWEAEHPAD